MELQIGSETNGRAGVNLVLIPIDTVMYRFQCTSFIFSRFIYMSPVFLTICT
jgi:hypothetical protein